MKTIIILMIIILILCIILFFQMWKPVSRIEKMYNDSNPGVLVTMINVPLKSNATDTTGPIPNIEALSLETCTKLGNISKNPSGIMDLTLLNKKFPLNVYNSREFITNIGLILDPKLFIPKSDPSKYIQCMGVRDRGSDLRRCDTDFSNKLVNGSSYNTTGKYIFPLRKITSPCTCTYDDNVSNKCDTKAEVAGCGAKCSSTGQVCGQVTWCNSGDEKKDAVEDGGLCAWKPSNISEFIEGTIKWNKANIDPKTGWNIVHRENELDAIVDDTPENQQMIYDSILGFVITNHCGATLQGIQTSCDIDNFVNKMKPIVVNFNKSYNKNVKLYLLKTDPVKNNGTIKDSKPVLWEDNNFVSDWSAFVTEIDI